MEIEMIGWVSSAWLVLTIGKRIHKQWQEKTSEGVSRSSSPRRQSIWAFED
jgi:hypothetical protein